jgi:hypothetical protein
MAKYRLQGADESFGIFDNENKISIPNANGNRDWEEYLQWKKGLDIDGEPLDGNPGTQTPDPQYTLDEAKVLKIIELKKACGVDISSGFKSSATGTEYTYESTIKDQLNIAGAAQTGVDLDFTVIDSSGKKIRVPHTASEIHTVFIEGVTIIQTKKQNLYSLLDQVDAATSLTSLESITYQ